MEIKSKRGVRVAKILMVEISIFFYHVKVCVTLDRPHLLFIRASEPKKLY